MTLAGRRSRRRQTTLAGRLCNKQLFFAIA
jgi:hypothetical protein